MIPPPPTSPASPNPPPTVDPTAVPYPLDCAECDALRRLINLALWFALNCADDTVLLQLQPPPEGCTSEPSEESR